MKNKVGEKLNVWQKENARLKKELKEKARELEIESALELVRARTMAMHQSSELSEASSTLFKQLAGLEIEAESSWITLINPEDDSMTIWLTHGTQMASPRKVNASDHPNFKAEIEAWKSGQEFIKIPMTKGAFNLASRETFDMEMENDYPEEKPVYVLNLRHRFGFLGLATLEPVSDKNIAIYSRFTKVFEQTYTRFLDLHKAEEQAREAQIELALERIRTHTMAMHHSDELREVVATLYEQFVAVGFDTWMCILILSNKNKGGLDFLLSNSFQSVLPDIYNVPEIDHPVYKRFIDGWKDETGYRVIEFGGKEKQEYDRLLLETTELANLPEEAKLGISSATKAVVSTSYMTHGMIQAVGNEPLPENKKDILLRFTKVFEQTYTRFLDLKKAEAQAREAQIEAALERVRSRTMGMQHSDELQETAVLLFQQVISLSVPAFATGFNIWDDDRKYATAWMGGQDRMQPPFKTSSSEDIFLRIYEAAQKGESLFVEEQGGEALKTHYEYMNSIPVFREIADKMALVGQSFPTFQIMHCAFFSHGYLMFISFEPVPDAHDIFKRFAKVFEQTYTRFLDLQKAEAQAREAQIEAALERVRSRAMAMQKSDELREVVGLVSEELNISLENTICIIMNFGWQSREIEWWSTGFNVDNLPESYKIPIHDTIKDHPLIRHYREAVKKGISYTVYKLEGEIKRSWDDYIFEQSDLKKIPLETQNWMRSYEGVICNEAFMSHGVLEVDGPEQLSDEKAEVLQRFAKVVDLTYKRIEDLQQAEARTVEAVRQASLDRVRGEIASMRTSEDLNRITPVIWRELQALEVPFIRCGVFIINEKQEKVHVYLTTPSGKALAALHLAPDANELTKNTVEHWRGKRIFKTHWDKKEFIAWTKSMVEIGQVENAETYQGSAEAPESLNLHFVPFRQGMLYVGDLNPLSNDKIELVKTLADAFSIAYARYEDFKNLEEAKNKIEITLTELKAAQKQLIQSEKMASLGELTAGIAHEIQNPLNFVNNFSEVSNELLDEMNEEMDKGDLDEAKAIAADIKQNLEKINHHGKRAESIVKGMLLHSRGSSGKKELTDINALADEYLRLSYHGFRAKDKSFNADFKLEAAESLPKIEVVPQDFGRVLLNLINNAFYVVNEKAKQNIEGYKPEVIVSTSSSPFGEGGNRGVKITVSDNGPGIPESIKEKIFQPFFTTKPTGQGTGLGLSLSYDIVKAHGGELALKSEVNSGTEFTITLPI